MVDMVDMVDIVAVTFGLRAMECEE